MSSTSGPRLAPGGIVLNLDTSDKKSRKDTGTVWYDRTLNSNNGFLSGGVTYNSSNKGSYVFDGSNDFVDCGNKASLNITTQLSVSTWVYFNSAPLAAGNPSIVDKWDFNTNNRSFALGTSSGNIVAFISSDGGNTNRITVDGGAPVLNQWTRLTMTYDNQTLRLYKDSVLVSSSAFGAVTNIHSSQATNTFLMRSRGTATSAFINGRLGQVSIYSKALSLAEIKDNFNANRSRFELRFRSRDD